jgi:hypothetical protein
MGNCMPYMVLLKNNDARYGYQKGVLRKSCLYDCEVVRFAMADNLSEICIAVTRTKKVLFLSSYS